MLTNDFFKDLYDERWGDPANPNAVGPSSAECKDRGGVRGVLSRLARFFHRRRNRPSAWSFTIPSETPDVESHTSAGHGNQREVVQPKFLNLAKALSRNC